MTLDDFRASLPAAQPPAGLSPPLAALWHLGREEWDSAHRIVQDEEDGASAWVHAHIHRIEGDLGNAGYWYRRAGKPAAREPLDVEWAGIAAALLAQGPGKP